MATMNISLPDALKTFVEQQVAERGYSTTSEYLRELIHREQERAGLRSALLRGASSPVVARADEDYFQSLRDQILRSAPE
jgi:antitoxin ParD1/3/4